MSSRELKTSETDKGIIPITIAYDGFAIIVNPENPVDNLTKKQVYDIFTGKITGWNKSEYGYNGVISIMENNQVKERGMKILFLIAACASILAVVLICLFLFANLPAIFEIGPGKFLLGTKWDPTNNVYGILPMIVGSLYVTAGAIIVGVPIGVLTAVFMAEFCPPKLYKIMKPAVELLAGIPSIVYGFFGLVALVPIIRNLFGGSGKGILTASILLGIMILPTIISISESALRAVPRSYYEGAVGLGATKERAVFFTMVPAARPAYSRESSWASDVRSGKRWPLLWSPGIRRLCRPAF